MKATDSANNVRTFTITGGQFVGRRPIVVSQTSLIGDTTKYGLMAGSIAEECQRVAALP